MILERRSVPGRYDAFNGLLLLGNGKGNFQPQTIQQSGLYIPGDAKALVKLKSEGGDFLIAASQNRNYLKVFHYKKYLNLVPLKRDDRFVTIYLSNGQKRKEELYYGNSFLSQSARFITMNDAVEKVEINNGTGGRIVINHKGKHIARN
jgi:hypothetical protein